jgi:hypothetical protein
LPQPSALGPHNADRTPSEEQEAMSPLMADYNVERKAFETLLKPECAERILLFRGKSGSGKTTLLRYCTKQIPSHIAHVPIQLRGSTAGIADIFSRAGQPLTWERLRKFTRQVAALGGTPNVQIDRNWLAGINNRINVVMHVESTADREYRRVALTDTWFEDIDEFPMPVVFLFDTYDQASTEVQEWLSGPFLTRAVYSPTVRVVVAGQAVPDHNNIDWGQYCVARDLYGVREAQHWLPIVLAMNRELPFGGSLTWLAGVCHALQGDPKSIMQVIEGLPRREVRT